ncbi:MAG: hypothetical protein D6B28_10660 [Gammaproteobacteria bacterium]|nr:MAG: hypothetical protein D6B28_10660 [Gammaproteobacteria bacterium]
MKRLIFVILVIAFSMTFGYFVKEHTGYVLIHVANTRIEMTLTFALIMVGLAFGVLLLALLIVKAIIGTPGQLSLWFSSRKRAEARKKFYQGITFLAEGCYADAEKKLTADIKNSERPQLNYIGAAIAAHCQGDFAKSDKYFAKAAIGKNRPEFAIGFVQSLLHLERGNNESALAKLGHLNQIKPNHEPVMQHLIEGYEQAQDWQSLHALIPIAKRKKIVDERTAIDIEVNSTIALLDTAQNSGLEVLKASWSNLPKIMRLNAEVISKYASGLIGDGAPNEAEKVLSDALKKNWNPKLIEQYGKIKISHPEKMLAKAEVWLKQYPDDPDLLLAAGRLAERAQIWTRAKEYMQASIDRKPTREALRTIGLLVEHLEGAETAIDYYRMATTI